MITPTKKHVCIIVALLVGVAFVASCSKQSEPNAGKKGGATPAVSKAVKNDKSAKDSKAAKTANPKAASFIPAGKSSLSAVRNGQYVTLNWQADLAGVKIKKIEVSKSSTGKITNRNPVATLEPGATSYKDTLPDENACSYWVRFTDVNGKFQEIGPARVDIDKAGSANYIKLADVYKISITRTDDQAVLKWDFPEEQYSGIRVVRALRPLPAPFKTGANAKPVVKTAERKSQYTDALGNPNSVYWYWFRITLKSGVIIDRGPIKAEYVGR